MLKRIGSMLLLLLATQVQAGYQYKTQSGVEIEFGARVVLQYRDFESQDYEEDDAFGLVAGDNAILAEDDALGLTTADQQFRVRRFRPSIDVAFNKDWEASLSWELAAGRRNIKDAYVRFRGIEWLDVRFGSDTVPFSRERITSSARQHSPERAITGDTEFGVPGRQPGLHLRTRFDFPLNLRLSYADANIHGDLLTEIQFINPWGRSEVEDNLQDEGTMTVARLEYEVFGKMRYREGHLKEKPALHLSAAILNWQNKHQAVEIDALNGWEVAAAYRGYDWSVDLQYHELTADSPYDIDKRLFEHGKAALQSYSVEVGHMFFDKQVELFGAYQLMSADAWSQDWQVKEVGMSYFLDGHQHKLQLSYRKEQGRKGRDADQQSLYLQWQYDY